MEQKKGTAEYYFKTGKENLDIFTWLTTEIYEPLLTPELVERLSIFLNYNLKDMVTVRYDFLPPSFTILGAACHFCGPARPWLTHATLHVTPTPTGHQRPG